MDDTDDPVECEYAEYERVYLARNAFWRVPAHRLAGTTLYRLFECFCAALPDHPHEQNTTFYLLEHTGISPTHFSVLLRCTHFEHTGFEDLLSLVGFLTRAYSVISEPGATLPHVELLNDAAEEVVLSFYDPRGDVRHLLRKHAQSTTPAS